MLPRTLGTYRCAGAETSTEKILFVSWCCRNGPRRVKVKRVPGSHKRYPPADRPVAEETAMEVGGGPQLTRKEALKLAKKREAELVQALQRLQIVETAATRVAKRRRRRVSAMPDGCAGGAVGLEAAGGAFSGHVAESGRAAERLTRRVQRMPSLEEVVVCLKAKKAAQMDIAGGAGDGYTLSHTRSQKAKMKKSKKAPRSKPSTCSDGEERRKKRPRRLRSDPGSAPCVEN
ncbi:hypothetical protein V5799_007426 [Amblyomma americanum]|uniref:Uncharacterized protein n=1 Tax=Amblyomma americanum TaxID=6943 RepID=A0AAQ4FHF4_AMBAM